MWKREQRTGLVSALFWAALLCASPALAGPIDPDNPPHGLFLDEWSIIHLNGQKCGYSHSTMTRRENAIKTSLLMTFRIERAGTAVAVTQMMTSEESLAGEPLAFTTNTEMGIRKVEQQGVIRNGKVTLRGEQFGNALVRTFDYPKGALMNWGLYRLQEQKGYEPGTAYEMKSYVPLDAVNAAMTIKQRIETREEITIDGKTHPAIRTAQETFRPSMSVGFPSSTWVDPNDHQPIKTVVAMAGMSMEMVRASREAALAGFEAPEAFMTTLVNADRAIDHQRVRRIKMKLVLDGDGPDLLPVPKTGLQTPSGLTARSVVLDVARQDHAALLKAAASARPDRKAFAEFLEPNIYINSDDPAVRKMADQAAGDAKTLYALADSLRRYVSETLTDKGLDIGFATASEVCRNRAGDCSEHAVLLAALARAKGLPSRVACGLVYVPRLGDAEQVFGFHMWTQVHVAGRWVDLDAAQDETDCNPTHIALAVSSLKDAGLGDMAFTILPVMSRLSIETLEIE